MIIRKMISFISFPDIELLETSLLSKDNDVSALLLKRISILRMIFEGRTAASKEEIIGTLKKAIKLNPLDS